MAISKYFYHFSEINEKCNFFMYYVFTFSGNENPLDYNIRWRFINIQCFLVELSMGKFLDIPSRKFTEIGLHILYTC